MTLRDLSSEVSALGFDGAIAMDGLFLTSLNRALRQIFGEYSVTGRITLSAVRSKPSTRIPRLWHGMGESLSLPLKGRAYSFFTSGTGAFTLRDGSNTVHKSFTGTRVRFSGFLSEGGAITFTGELGYLVTDIVTFDEIFSQNVSDIPDGRGQTCIQIRDKVGDFLSFISPPTDSNGKELSNVRMEDGAIHIKNGYEGELDLVYRRLPRPILTENPDQTIDIPPEYEVLLGPLVASYVYLDSDPEKAELYGKLYRSITEREASLHKELRTSRYVTNGWA